jgi:hypothetical protein
MDKPQLTGALAGITNGKIIRPIYALISGLPGVGKTTLASKAPSPVFLGLESGTYQLPVSRFPKAQTLADFLAQLRGLSTEKHPFKTIVLDTVDALEDLIWRQVCYEGKVESIGDYGGGYGLGYVRAMEIWRSILHELATVLVPRYHVLLTGHVAVKTFQDPNQASGYDRYQLKINEKAAGVIREAVDLMLFCTFRTDLIRDKKTKEVRALTDGTRVMYTEFRPAFLEAKNRFSLPFEMPLEWAPLAKAIRTFYDLNPTEETPKPEEPKNGSN